MTIKTLDDGTSYTKAHAHDWEDPDCLIKGRVEIYRKIDGIRAIRNSKGEVWSRNSKPLPHLSHLEFRDAEIFRGSWNETSSILGSITPPHVPLSQENVYELTDGNIDPRLYIGWAKDPSNENLRDLMYKYLAKGDEGLIVRVAHRGKKQSVADDPAKGRSPVAQRLRKKCEQGEGKEDQHDSPCWPG